jgi:hypothetical protein
MQFVRAVLQDRHGGDRWDATPAPLAFGIDVSSSLWDGQVKAVRPKLSEPLGVLVAHVCRGCGFTELYTHGFAELPIGPQHGTELIDVGPQGPDDGPFR